MMELLLVVINSGIIPYMFGYAILAIFEIILLQTLTRKRIIVNSVGTSPFWILAVTGLFYAFAVRYRGVHLIRGMLYYCLFPVLVYMTGYSITNNRRSGAVLTAERCLCAIAIGCSIHVILNISANANVGSRVNTVDFFNGKLAATNLGSLNTYIFALLPCLMVTRRKKIRLIGFALFACSVVFAFILGTRTQPYALLIIAVVSAFIYVRRHYRKGIKASVLLKWLCVAAAVVFVAVTAYRMDLGGIRTRILMSNLLDRYQARTTVASDDYRTSYLISGLKNLFESPLGSTNIMGDQYYHNYWLDFGRVAGTLPVALLVIMDVTMFRHMLRIFRISSIDEDFRYALLGIYICMFMNFFMEPIMDGYLELFYRFTLINGMVEGLYARYYKRERSFISRLREDRELWENQLKKSV